MKPLPSLLWNVLEALEGAYATEGAGRGQMPSLDLWANLLRVLDEAGVDAARLPAMLRLSNRGVRTRLSLAVRRGWVEERRAGRRMATVHLTARGAIVAGRWRLIEGAAEETWRARVGVERVPRLRAALEKAVSALPLEHPHYPASYGPADASITGGNGQDWKAVPREAGDTVSQLPVSALVSQLLVAFAMKYEEKGPAAFSLAAGVLTRLPDNGRPARELGNRVGLSALARHGFVRVTGSGEGEVVALTTKGRAVAEGHEERLRAVERDWRGMMGDGTVRALRGALYDLQSSTTL